MDEPRTRAESSQEDKAYIFYDCPEQVCPGPAVAAGGVAGAGRGDEDGLRGGAAGLTVGWGCSSPRLC